jgi:hypothetical protein
VIAFHHTVFSGQEIDPIIFALPGLRRKIVIP